MASLVFAVTRPDDLFQAAFRFEGFRLEPGAPPTLVREAAGAGLVVELAAQSIAEQVLPVDGNNIIHPPAPPALLLARRSGRSRIAFRIPAEVETIPLSLDAWLDWDAFEPALPVDADEGLPDELEPPGRDATAIELPFRLILSPEAGGRWRHRRPVPAPGPVELWRTALAGDLSVRAVWTPDLGGAQALPFATALSSAARRDAVGLTSELHLLDRIREEFLSEEQRQEAALLSRRVAVPIRARRLELSALGGTLDLRHDFPDIDLTNFVGFFDELSLTGRTRFFSLAHWAHRALLGRDQHVRTVTAGHLFPYGHRALRVDVTERVLVHDPLVSRDVAWLVVRTLIVVDEEERRYIDADFPFETVRFPADASLEVPTPPPGLLAAFVLPASATDRAGATHAFVAQLLFVTGNAAPEAFEQYARLDRDAPLSGAPLAFVSGAGGALPATLVRIKAQGGGAPGGAVPVMEIARVIPDAVAAFAGAQREVAIEYVEAVAGGAAPDVFARMLSPLPVPIPAARLGGLAAPHFELDRLSRTAGVTIAAPPNPADLLQKALGGKLLGFLDLAKWIDLSGAEALAAALPAFRSLADGETPRVEFTWTPRLKMAGASLTLSGSIGQVGGVPDVSLRGELSNFTLNFAELVSFGFKRLGFSAGTGRAVSVETMEGKFAFWGDLAFLSRISDAFSKAAPGAPAGTRVAATAEGITATMQLALPDLAMGQFTIIDLGLNAALTLRFDGPARVSLGLGSRAAPFLMSYNGLGGGGHFQLVSDLETVVSLEAAIEFGAVVAIDLAILRASAQVVAGIYIRLENTPESQTVARLGGYVRAHGAVEVFGIVTVTLDVMLSLTLQDRVVTGSAQVTILVRLLAFSRSVSFSFSQSFDAGAVLPGAMTMTGNVLREGGRHLDVAVHRRPPIAPADWNAYCGAFA